MASMNFPANPTVGQEYVWEDFIYEWDGEKWTTQVTVVADNHVLKTGDTMTGKLTLPNLQTDAFLAFQEVNQLGTVLSSNSAGYTEIVRRTDAGPEWSTGLRAYGGTDWRIGDVPIITAAGGELTGDLTIHPPGANKVSTSVIAGEVGINFSNEDGTRVGKWSVNNAGNTEIYHIQSDGSIKEVALKTYPDTSEVGIVTPFMFGNQGTRGESLTRKDYVDSGFIKRNLPHLYDWTSAPLMADGICFASVHSDATNAANGRGYVSFAAGGNTAPAVCDVFTDGEYYASNGEAKVYHELNPPTAAEVGAVPREEHDSIIAALIARIEALEAQVNPAS